MNIRLKVFKGTIRCSCEHVKNHEPQPSLPPPSPPVSDAYRSYPNAKCLYSSAEFCSLLLECLKLNSRICQNAVIDVVPVKPLSSSTVVKYKPTINVIDTENDNICMCALYASSDDILNLTKSANDDVADARIHPIAPAAGDGDSMVGTICVVCRNTIKLQPTEHRKTLISKRLTLANDIIVNRVDTHYLSLNSFPCKYPDPYTPESVESHSPLPEMIEFELKQPNLEINQNTIESDNKHSKIAVQASSKAVSPRQLKSRLESLQRPPSVLLNSSDVAGTSSTAATDATTSADKNLGCIERYCQIV